MKARALLLCLLAPLLSCAACGPQLEQFATVTLLVREPALAKPRFGTQVLKLVSQLDDQRPDTIFFDPGVDPETAPILLGDKAHTLVVTLATGNPGDAPSALGRADPLSLPVAGASGVPAQLALSAPVLLARPNVAEPIDAEIPTGRSGSAACYDDAGRAWVIGGVDGNNVVQNAYSFELDSLKANVAFKLDVGGDLACDGDGQGGLVAVGVVAGLNPVPTLLLGASTPQPTRIGLAASEAQAAFVQVVGGVVWVGNAAAFHVFRLGDGGLVASGSGTVDPGVHYLALDDTHALRFPSGGGAQLLTVNGTAISADSAVFGSFVAADVHRHAVLESTAGVLQLDDVKLDGDAAVFTHVRDVSFDGVVPQELVLLPDGRAAVFARDDATQSAAVDVEGSPQAAVGDREHMAVTVGGALLLFGGAPGHDVLIAP